MSDSKWSAPAPDRSDSPPPISFAAERPGLASLDNNLAQRRCWLASQRVIHQLSQCLARAVLPPEILTVAISGSIGRMELTSYSDADILVIARAGTQDEPSLRGALVDAVWDVIGHLALPRPLPGGIFTRASSADQLLDRSRLGVIAEDVTRFGHRMQLLLDAQPLYGATSFSVLQRDVLEWYGAGDAALDPGSSWDYLTHDLVRYLRCLAIDAQWKRRDQPFEWRLFAAKLDHSRRVLFVGLLWLLAESLTTCDPRIPWLTERLRLTPLERLVYVMDRYAAPERETVVGCYDRFLERLGDPRFRCEMAVDRATGTRRLTDNAAYQTLLSNGEQLAGALVSFLWARREDWPARFWSSWLL